MSSMNSKNKLRKSFAIIITGCIAVIFFVGFDNIRAKVRDVKRKADLKEIAKALDIYYDRYNEYPDTIDDDWNGWDATYEPKGGLYEFIPQLIEEEILIDIPRDPYNDENYFYRYKKFSYGSHKCLNEYYILQIVNFETLQEDHGKGNCPDFDFVTELPNGYTIMGAQ